MPPFPPLPADGALGEAHIVWLCEHVRQNAPPVAVVAVIEVLPKFIGKKVRPGDALTVTCPEDPSGFLYRFEIPKPDDAVDAPLIVNTIP